MEWEGDRGTKKAPNVGRHKLYSFLTTARTELSNQSTTTMPVLLMSPADVERWLEGTAEEALQLQRPAPDDAIVIDPDLGKEGRLEGAAGRRRRLIELGPAVSHGPSRARCGRYALLRQSAGPRPSPPPTLR